MVAKLNTEGFKDLVLVDDFSRADKQRNYNTKTYAALVNRDELEGWLRGKERLVQFVIHLGARTDTSEKSTELFNRLNLHYSQMVWRVCTEFQIPLIYASSAATYGRGELGFSDDHAVIPKLQPQNPYAVSKNQFDNWVLQQDKTPFFWAGFKFFNVYGPNEYHKGRMASVIFHAYNQIKDSGKLRLFRSHRPEYADGGQLRDFIYVKDVVNILFYMMQSRKHNGIYNLGTGQARTFLDLGTGVFKALGLQPAIDYVDIPADIRDSYQYYTQAEMGKLRAAGYQPPFYTLEAGIEEYVTQYLQPSRVY
jgi:ADP-L-glycero-D-manno-heptose 6-epimerase